MSEQALRALQQIDARIAKVIQRIGVSHVLTGAIVTTALLAFLWLVATSLEAGLWLPNGTRTMLFWIVVVVAAIATIGLVVVPALRLIGVLPSPDSESTARTIGYHFPEVSDKLINLLHLGRGQHSPAESTMVSAAVTALAEQIAPVPIEQVEEFQRPRALVRWMMLPVGVLILFLIAAPSSFLGASQRLLSPGKEFSRPASFTLAVRPGSAQLLRGQPLAIVASVNGTDLPESGIVSTRFEGETRVEQAAMVYDSSGTFKLDIANVRRSFQYRVETGSVFSEWFDIRVLQRPLIGELKLQLDFPRYSGIPRQVLQTNVGDVSALRGTTVSVDVVSDGPALAGAYILHNDGARDSLDVDAHSASGTFRVRTNGTYQVMLVSEDGISNESPIGYSIRVLDDTAPNVAIVEPDPVHEIEDNGTVDVGLRIADDFGFRDLELRFRLSHSRFGTTDSVERTIDIPLPGGKELLQNVQYVWNVNESFPGKVIPGNEFEYYAVVRDNDAVSGYKPANSAVHKLIVPSLADKIQRMDEMGEDALDTLRKMQQESGEMRNEFDELRKELQNDQSADWEDQRQLNQLERQQQSAQETAEKLSQQLEEMTQRMKEEEILSPETQKLFQDLQRVAEEINSEELQDALQELREAMQNMDMQQMQKALDNFEFNEKQYQERLQRSLDLLEKLQVQQQMEEVAELAKELAERQEEMSKKTEQMQQEGKSAEETSEEREGLSEEQKQSAEDMKNIEERLEQLEQKMQDMKNAPSGEMEDLRDQVERQSMPERMEQNAEQLQQNQLSPAQQGQQQMSQDLQQMQQQMSQMQQGMQGAQMQVDMAGLRRALNDILELSAQQESQKDNLDNLLANTGSLREQAREQLRLEESLRAVRDSLVSLASNIPQMTSQVQEESANALREMGSATSAMSEGVSRRASGHQRSSMMHLNELALLLSDLMSAMNNSSAQAGGGQSMEQMMQQLQQMANDQQQLNGQVQQMLNDMAGQRLTQDMEARMRQLAGQQEALRKQLHEMSRNPQLNGKALGDLKRIAEQMEETVRELESRRGSRRTSERQQQILTRLLESTRAMQEREKDDKRESRSADDVARESPSELPKSEQIDRLRRELIRALDAGYSPDYEELIKRYFDLLQERQN